MAMDEALLEAAASLGQPVLRFYSWTEPAATFGYFQHFAEIARTTQLRPLIRRPTGGGLVPHDADWTYSVVIPPGHPWHALNAVDSYRRMHEWIRAAFARLGVATELADCCRKSAPGQCFVGWEKFDVLWQGRKIAGAAQRRNKLGLLIQGSVQPPPVGLERKGWEAAMVSVEVGRAQLEIAPDICRGTPSLPSEGGEGRGEEGRPSSEAPLSPALSPLVPRREREPESAVSRCAQVGIASLAELKVTSELQNRVTGLAKERYSSAAYNERRRT